MFVVGLASIGCFICITRSLTLAPASLLAPFQYTSHRLGHDHGLRWCGATFRGRTSILGSAVIVASGLAVFWREQIRGRAVAEGVAPVP